MQKQGETLAYKPGSSPHVPGKLQVKLYFTSDIMQHKTLAIRQIVVYRQTDVWIYIVIICHLMN